MKLPNGFGTIVKYTDKPRRRPYVVKKTIDGRQRIVGRFETHADALAFLVDYNKQPAIYGNAITFSEIYSLMARERYPKLAETTRRNYESAYKHCSMLYTKRFIELKISDYQNVINNITAGYATQKKCRQLIHHIYTYAIKYDIIPAAADVSQYIDIAPRTVKYPKRPFNTHQINRVKRLAVSDPWAMCVVMMCYSGVRTGEFLAVRKTDVKLRQRYFIVHNSKTEAGRNRPVPINRKALPYFDYWMQTAGQYLITDNGKPLTYHKFRRLFDKVMTASRCRHTPHECRHTFATWLDNAGANETAVKRILGHASQGVTKSVYTHKSLHELKRAIDLL